MEVTLKRKTPLEETELLNLAENLNTFFCSAEYDEESKAILIDIRDRTPVELKLYIDNAPYYAERSNRTPLKSIWDYNAEYHAKSDAEKAKMQEDKKKPGRLLGYRLLSEPMHSESYYYLTPLFVRIQELIGGTVEVDEEKLNTRDKSEPEFVRIYKLICAK